MLRLVRSAPLRHAFLPVLLAAAGPAALHGTTVVKMTFSEVVDAATVISVGTVSSVEYVWDAERGTPYTDVTFADLYVLHGSIPGSDLTLRFTGGPTPDGLVLEIAGMPRFTVGQRTVVFSDPAGGGICPLVGWWQGLYRVARDTERGVDVVFDHAGVPMVGFDGPPGELVARVSAPAGPARAGAPPSQLTLDTFTALIQAEL